MKREKNQARLNNQESVQPSNNINQMFKNKENGIFYECLVTDEVSHLNLLTMNHMGLYE